MGGDLVDGTYVMISETFYGTSGTGLAKKEIITLLGNQYYWGQTVNGGSNLYALLGTFSTAGSTLSATTRECATDGSPGFIDNSPPGTDTFYFTFSDNVLSVTAPASKVVKRYVKQ
jgi:hypothetical protein